MTQKEAKELTLEVWTYLAEHPECYAKIMVPPQTYKKIRDFTSECPLCEYFTGVRRYCEICPLYSAGESCGNSGSLWNRWVDSDFGELAVRKAAAERIVEIVSAWETEEE